MEEFSEIKDDMQIDWDCPIEMDDGLVLRADIFRPINKGKFPVIITYGPYAKGLPFQQGYPSAWDRMVEKHPDVTAGSSNKYQNWEVVDPEKWVSDGYVCVRIDSRGCGTSPGYIDHFSPRETLDFENCIEWAGQQKWSNGNVGINGVSYYGINQWQVASRQPKYLKAMCIWEGASDWYRDMTHHGGILSTFWANWFDMQVKTVQYGLGNNGMINQFNDRPICGDTELTEAELEKNRCNFGDEIKAHPMMDEYHKERSAVWEKITIPFLSAGNWGGQGLHLRGNTEGFDRAASNNKWLEMHGLEHWTEFYTDYGVNLQKRFFDHYLKGVNNDWDQQPRVQLQVRYINGFKERHEDEWPIERTQWTKMYLDAENNLNHQHSVTSTSSLSFAAMDEGLNFKSQPFKQETELTGPLALRLFISSSTPDTDLFVVMRLFSDIDKEIVFQGAVDPYTPIAQGWLRASHRKLDTALSKPWRPYHSHDQKQLLHPNEIVELDIEIWPTSIVIPENYYLVLTVKGKDYEYPLAQTQNLSNFKNQLTGCGPFLHNDPFDRNENLESITTLHFSPEKPSYLLLPIIPEK
jgi:hypothetical protein